MTTEPTHTSVAFAVTLTTIAGYIDAFALLSHGVMTNAQTGNVILLATALAQGRWSQVGSHIWSLLAFLAGVALATHINRSRVEKAVRSIAPTRNPLAWLIAGFAVSLMAVGFVPHSAPVVLQIVPLAVIGGMLFELFRSVGPLKYVPVTTTGNLVRLIEDLHGTLLGRKPDREALPIHAAIVVAFIIGAMVGALVTHAAADHAVWGAALGMCALLGLFIRDARPHTGRA